MSVQEILKALREGRISAEDAKRALNEKPRSAVATKPDVRVPDALGPVAIVGMSGRYPNAEDLDRFWKNLLAGRDSIAEIPRARWDVDQFFDPTPPFRGKIYCKWLGALDDVECFDPLFFNISPADAEMMDPQHRMFMEEAYRSFEDAGYGLAALSGVRCGVYFGVMNAEYSMVSAISAATPGNMAGTMTGNSHSIGAARIAYYLNLKGPALAVDTACSSSLVATHLACQALRSREVDMAVAGGATLYLTPGSYIGMCAAGMLSPAGRCKAFDNTADGFVPGEGVGAIVLKRLSDAEADGDSILGVIVASGINQDGRTNGITAPSKSSQMELARSIYARFSIDPDTIDYVEMHGTGTKLGDPIELEALSTVFRERTSRRAYCVIGSVKSNIGHTSAAAGVASVHKVLLSMRHGTLVPSLHFDRPNEHFDFESSPFYVSTKAQTWNTDAKRPRRAAVSSFGFSGTNSHLVLEQYRDERARRTDDGEALVVLSARSEERLQCCASRLIQHLTDAPGTDLHELAYTLQVGRDAMDYRASIRVSTTDELIARLHDFVTGRAHPAVQSSVAAAQAELAALFEDEEDAFATQQGWFASGALDRLEQLWLKGFAVEWHRLYPNGHHRRLRLPTYPFEKERYWLAEQPSAELQQSSTAVTEAGLHPLLQRNCSDFATQRYASTFSGDEFFFEDHRVGGRRVLPAAAHLEMAREAIARSMGLPHGVHVRLTQVAWLRPLAIDDRARPPEVMIALQRENGQTVSFRVFPDGDEHHPYCRGKGTVDATPARSQLDPEDLHGAADTQIWMPGDDHYAIFEQGGIAYRGAFRSVAGWCRTDSGVLARICVPPPGPGTAFVVHPAVLDGAFQALLGMAPIEDSADDRRNGPVVPFALDSLTVHAPTTSRMSAHIRTSTTPGAGAIQRVDIDLVDEDRRICVEIRGLACRALGAGAREAALAGEQLHTLRYGWEPVVQTQRSGDLLSARRGERTLLVAIDDSQLSSVRDAYENVELLPLADCADTDHEALVQRLRDAGDVHHVIWLAPSAAESAQDAGVSDDAVIGAQRFVVAAFRLVKVLIALGYWRRELRWTVITRGAVAVHDEDPVEPSQSALRGLFGVLSKEYPRWIVTQLDVVPDGAMAWEQLQQMEAEGGTFARRKTDWLQPSLQPAVRSLASEDSLYRKGGLYVVIGGAGGIGEVWSEWMVRRYGARLAWIGRRPADEAIAEKLDRLEALGHRPLYLQADALDASALESARQAIRNHYGGDGAIHGIVNSAAVLADASLANMSQDAFCTALRAKVDTSVNLGRVFANEPLDFVLFFSSLQSFFQDPGQANYAAGCTFQDAYGAFLARRLKRPVKVINWGYWGSIGVATTHESRTRMAQKGVGSIEPGEAMQVLAEFMADRQSQIAVIKLTTNEQALRPVPALAAPGAKEMAQPAGDELRTQALHLLSGLVATVMKVPPHQIDPMRPLQRYGLDSIVAMQLSAALGDLLGELDSMIFFEYPTLNAMVEHLAQTRAEPLVAAIKRSGAKAVLPAPIGNRATQDATARPTPVETPPERGDIAIIGMAGRYPGARDVDELWQKLRDGYDSVQEVPAARWDHALYFDPDKGTLGKTYCRWGSFIDGVDLFDPLFFDISPRAADSLDPQVRLCLQTVWELMENAAYTRDRMARKHGSSVGVYIGAMYQQYQMLETDYVVNAGVSLSSYAAIANRISNFFDFNGPSVAVDTQCSSSMVALHTACRALRDGECEVAVAGGINLLIHPKKYLGLSMLAMLGSDRTSRTFGDGDGYLPSEGVGAVLLKPLACAERDGDSILGVIKYSGQNHSGRGFGYGTQNTNAQFDLMRMAFERGGIDPRTITYVEVSANGTPISDAMESSALIRAHERAGPDAPRCAVGAIKSNMGHTESASGIAQLTKVLLQFRNRQIAPMFRVSRRNPKVQFEGSRFYVQTHLEDWKRPVINEAGRPREFPRRAAINTFGGGGSLAHLIVEEYALDLAGRTVPSAQRTETASVPQLVVLSAKNEDRLSAVVGRLLDHIRAHPASRLDDLAATLQVGREAMECRVAIIAEDLRSLELRLDEIVAGNSRDSSVYRSAVASKQAEDHEFQSHTRASVRLRAAAGDLESIAKAWVCGTDVDWEDAFEGRVFVPVALPTYPFEQRRCWLDESDEVRYSESRIMRGDFDVSYDQAQWGTEATVYSAICAALGIDRAELDVDQSLSRHVMLPVFRPLFARHLESHTGIQLNIDELASLETARQIAELAARSEREVQPLEVPT